MAIQASGNVVRDRQGLELFIERRIAAPLPEVEAWLATEDLAAEVTISLAELGDYTAVYLRQRVASAREAGELGPVCEYTLDRLAAAVTGAPQPELEGYVPSQRPYYERLAMDGDPVSWPPS